MALDASLLKRVAGKTTAEIDNSEVAMPTLSKKRQWEVAARGDIVATVAVVAGMAGSAILSIHSCQSPVGGLLKTHNHVVAGTHSTMTP